SERLKVLGLDSLEYRRIKSDLTLYFKIAHDEINIEPILVGSHNTKTRNNGFSFLQHKWYGSIERYSFSHRFVNIWNNLPRDVVEAANVSTFLSLLDSLDMTKLIRKSNHSY